MNISCNGYPHQANMAYLERMNEKEKEMKKNIKIE